MAVVEDTAGVDVFGRAGLPRDDVAAWLDSGDAVTGDFRRDVESLSRRWRIGAELLMRLRRKPARSQAETIAATAILERDRARLESSLQQIRRMETIGAVASGVAHNFNNIIGVIDRKSVV